MTVHFFTKGDENAGSSRQRAFMVSSELALRGIDTIVHEPSLILVSSIGWPHKLGKLLAYLSILRNIKKGDVIYLQRTIYNKYFFIMIIFYKFFTRRKMIFDFDDAIYLHSPIKTALLTKFSDAVVVGSHALRDWAVRRNDNVFIIPTCVKVENYSRFAASHPDAGESLNIGWVGGAPDQYDNLALMVPVFQELMKRNIPVRFTLIGALGNEKVYELFDIEGMDVTMIDSLDWKNPTVVPSEISRFHIGIMPLVDNDWNRGKCSFKAIEYMALGVATIVSRVGENLELIEDGINGFLAGTTEEWVEKITRFHENRELLVVFGKQGQQTIEKRYSYDANIPKLIKILDSLHDKQS